MGAFDYQALDSRGKTKRGVATGDTARQVRSQLRDQGLTPIAVDPVREKGEGRADKRSGKDGASKGGPRRKSRTKMSAAELSVITRQFSTLLNSGLTIEDGLNALIANAETHSSKSTLSAVRSSVMEGVGLADSMRQFPRSFPDLYAASVAAGEETGHLDVVLERLADYTETSHGLRQRLSMALVYPFFLVLTAVGIVVGLLWFVVPKVVSVYTDTGATLPFLTRALIAMSEFLQSYGLVLLAVVALAVTAFVMIFRQEGPKEKLHGFMLRVPGVKRMVRTINSARMGRTLSIMVGSGVPLLASMKASEGVLTNLVMRKSLAKAAVEVQEGVALGRALQRTGRFPPLLVQMVTSGESSGKLDEMLDKSAMAMERELEARIGVMVGLFEPVMILVMGALVLTIVLAILMPIFDLNQLIG